ncbi:MFS transporter [Phenylobacterium sp.]|uniref:spinster family MFS transporter n=1 Tax=Phenylobacterium sp. TaxID=1871053 RepID=UPI001212205B|nr:MFS transporter [Phenylobacterium sp.]THD65921.1 MAG: MFS transporter [Phenylobacterium sp.]
MADITTPTGEALVDEATAHTVPPVSNAYRRYALWLLLLIYVVNFIDRQVINILAEPIKNDLHLADWQLGLLSGFAFGIVYTLLGFPLARAADRHHRGYIIAACLAAWSAFTGACGFAQNFAQLVSFRAGVGIGEAGCTPTSHALIADYSPKEKRASALAFYAMGTPIGSLLGLAIGGAMSDYFGWRQAFMVAAVPGLILAIVAAFTLKEPRAKLSAAMRAAGQGATGALATFSETIRFLSAKRAFWFMAWGAGIRSFLGYGHATFAPSFFYRCHGPAVIALAHQFHMRPQTFIGVALGVIGGVAGTLGSWTGGQIADRWGARDLRVYGSVPALAVVISVPAAITLYLTPSVPLALSLIAVTNFVGTLWYGPIYASAQGMVPQRMRAMSASIMLFVINFLGLVLGALCIGALSDILNKGFHLGPAEGVRWALILSVVGGGVSALLFWLARKNVREEMIS